MYKEESDGPVFFFTQRWNKVHFPTGRAKEFQGSVGRIKTLCHHLTGLCLVANQTLMVCKVVEEYNLKMNIR